MFLFRSNLVIDLETKIRFFAYPRRHHAECVAAAQSDCIVVCIHQLCSLCPILDGIGVGLVAVAVQFFDCWHRFLENRQRFRFDGGNYVVAALLFGNDLFGPASVPIDDDG